jgi:iron complex transport system ATP-binding protein
LNVRVEPTGTQDAVRALRAAAVVGPYFAVTVGPDAQAGRRPAGDLYTDPAVLGAVVERVRRRLGTTEVRVAASIFFQGWAARLWSVGLAVLDHSGRPPVLTPATLWWGDDAGSVSLGVSDPRLAAGELDDLVVGQHLEPLAAAVHRVVPVADRVLWGNAASALRGAARALDGASPGTVSRSVPVGAVATRLLARGRLTGALDDAGRRRSCCLYYRVPGGGICGDCVLAR